MVHDDFRIISEQILPEERAEKCPTKGQFTKYISKRISWHASDYIRTLNKKPKNVEIVSLDAMANADNLICYVDSIQELQTVLAFEQELQRLNSKEKELLRWLLETNCNGIAVRLGCTTSNIYKKRKVLSIKLESIKE